MNRPRCIHRVSGAFKILKEFQLQQIKLFNYVEVIVMTYFHFMASLPSEEDIDHVTEHGLEVRLLVENVSIPSTQPAIPKELTKNDFYYKVDNRKNILYRCNVCSYCV